MDKKVLKVKSGEDRENCPVAFEDDFYVGHSKLDTQHSGPYEIQRIKGANVWIKPMSGGAVIKTHRKFLKKMLIDEWSPEKDE
uniref:DUF1080 domain-containing protein n=1 Tax=Strongyloides papillosus TaxID=174720 RepID=A0A0N5BAP7_STREA